MLLIKKHLVPLFEGNAKKGFIHICILDEKGYLQMIEEVDKNDICSNEVDNWPEWNDFAGLAYERKTKKGYKDWWLILPIHEKIGKINVNTVAHEALHITRMILDSRGVKFDPHNDEPFAYMVGWITGTTWDSIPNKYKLTTKKK